jgi:hypothetical protein
MRVIPWASSWGSTDSNAHDSTPGLGEQHPIERTTVVQRQERHLPAVFRRDLQTQHALARQFSR